MGVDAEMFARTKKKITKGKALSLAYELGSAFGHQRFWIFKDRESPRHCLKIVNEFDQDGDTIYPEKGETFIRVYPATRFYGRGYERGDLPFLIMLAEWLELKIPDCEVWYGGDSSGICATRFDREARTELFRYFCEVNHQPYVRGFGDVIGSPNSPSCDLCKVPMIQNGFGGGYSGFYCSGCGEELESRDGGITFRRPVNENAAR